MVKDSLPLVHEKVATLEVKDKVLSARNGSMVGPENDVEEEADALLADVAIVFGSPV